jgi:hypothetical protein
MLIIFLSASAEDRLAREKEALRKKLKEQRRAEEIFLLARQKEALLKKLREQEGR